MDVWSSKLYSVYGRRQFLYHVKRNFLEMGIAIYYLIRKESEPAITKIAKCSWCIVDYWTGVLVDCRQGCLEDGFPSLIPIKIHFDKGNLKTDISHTTQSLNNFPRLFVTPLLPKGHTSSQMSIIFTKAKIKWLFCRCMFKKKCTRVILIVFQT
jgi:hypothetical protein